MQSFKVLCHIKWVRRREERHGEGGLKTLSHAIAAAAAAVEGNQRASQTDRHTVEAAAEAAALK